MLVLSDNILCNEFMSEFSNGFFSVAPIDREEDENAPFPWCAPWLWLSAHNEIWFNDRYSPYKMGCMWAYKNYDLIA